MRHYSPNHPTMRGRIIPMPRTIKLLGIIGAVVLLLSAGIVEHDPLTAIIGAVIGFNMIYPASRYWRQ